MLTSSPTYPAGDLCCHSNDHPLGRVREAPWMKDPGSLDDGQLFCDAHFPGSGSPAGAFNGIGWSELSLEINVFKDRYIGY